MAALTQEQDDFSKVNSLISFKNEENGLLYFTIENTNVSFVNAVRRTILSDTPTLVFKCFPDDKNDATFHTNTTRLNNEVLKQRLQCIPIHINDISLPYQELVVEINVKNDTENTMDVTTEHFRVKNEKTGKYLTDNVMRKMFPPCPITKEYILFARLRPKVSTIIPGEELSINAKMSLNTASEDGSFNVASICSYRCSPDNIAQDSAWQQELANMPEEEKTNASTLEMLKKNWYNHKGLRYYKKDSFDFKLESVGVYSNNELIIKACDIIIESIESLSDKAIAGELLPVEKSISTIKNAVDIKLENIDYTIGKIIECVLHDNYYQGGVSKILSYVGFRKNHPHDAYSIIRLGFFDTEIEASTAEKAREIIHECCSHAKNVINNIKQDFVD